MSEVSKKIINNYGQLLEHGYKNLSKYKEIRNKFPPEVECSCSFMTRKDCDFHRLNDMMIDDTGIEVHLINIYLEQILELNTIIYTTSSTNYPSDAKFQPMFIGFYAPLSLVTSLCQKLEDKSYCYIVIDEVKHTIMLEKCSSSESYENSIVAECKKDPTLTEFPDTLNATSLFIGLNPIVYVTIEDLLQERRNLYLVILNLLKDIQRVK